MAPRKASKESTGTRVSLSVEKFTTGGPFNSDVVHKVKNNESHVRALSGQNKRGTSEEIKVAQKDTMAQSSPQFFQSSLFSSTLNIGN